jgi:hypothetical protein
MADEARLHQLLDIIEQARKEGDTETERRVTARYQLETSPSSSGGRITRGGSSKSETEVANNRRLQATLQQMRGMEGVARLPVRVAGQATATSLGGAANLVERAGGDSTPESGHALRRWMDKGLSTPESDEAARAFGQLAMETPGLGQGLRATGAALNTAGEAIRKVPGGDMAIPVAGMLARAPSGIADLAALGKNTFSPEQRAIRTSRNIAKDAAGENLPSIEAAMEKAPGNLNAGQAAAGINQDPWQALVEYARRNDKSSEFRMMDDMQEAMREGRLAGSTPNLSRAKSKRSEVTAPLYQAAEETEVVVGKELQGLLDRMPKGIMAMAAEDARVAGRPFMPTDPKNPRLKPRMTGEDLHFIKLALDRAGRASSSPDPALSSLGQQALALREPYLNFVESRIPAYAQARLQYAELSKPVNQSEVMSELSKTLRNSAGGERVGPFASAVEKTPGTVLSRATGQSRFKDGELDKVLNPGQLSAVNQVLDELRRDTKLGVQARAGEGGLQRVLRKNQSVMARAPQWMSSKTVIYNKVAQMADVATAERVVNKLVDGMKTGKSATQLLASMTDLERRIMVKLAEGQSRTDKIVGATTIPAAIAASTPREE